MTELPEKNVPFVNPRAAHDFRGRTCSIVSVGSYVPERRLSNAELEKLVDTSDEWITTRTGIKERRLAADDQFTSDLAAEAAKKALEKADIDPEAIDLIIVATITPDMPFPSTACLVQQKIGATHAAAFDLEAACSGFIYALEVAQQFIMSRTYDTVLVIGAEKLSSIVDWKDRNTCVLFGDGAGAAVLQYRAESHGLLTACMGADGSKASLLSMPGGGVVILRPSSHSMIVFIFENGRQGDLQKCCHCHASSSQESHGALSNRYQPDQMRDPSPSEPEDHECCRRPIGCYRGSNFC